MRSVCGQLFFYHAYQIVKFERQSMPHTHGYYLEDLSVGQEASFSKKITEEDIVLFAKISGDTNPVHLDEEFAATTPFKTRIAHGMLSASLVSAVLGTKLPGPGCIYLSQTLKFKAPVFIGDTVDAICSVKEIDDRRGRVTIECQCLIEGKAVLTGEAMVMVAKRPIDE
jgi:3-hydroxybutyryl-CoA dehydratase